MHIQDRNGRFSKPSNNLAYNLHLDFIHIQRLYFSKKPLFVYLFLSNQNLSVLHGSLLIAYEYDFQFFIEILTSGINQQSSSAMYACPCVCPHSFENI